ncbi:MAG: type I DNA topoisomerase, partial [bacterium]
MPLKRNGFKRIKMQLVIVESPTKANTISRYLGKDYEVVASMGHIRDLPRTVLGIDIENNFEPKYQVMPKKKQSAKAIKDSAKKAELLILATDEDREGEAISWHLLELLKAKNYQRIVFHEITKKAIQEALENPRQINMNLVDAQQARRVLDRLVGYKLSPFLWKKVAKRLSAGRVQSVAVRLIADREEEIKAFKPQEYWSLIAEFKEKFKANLINQKIENKKEIDKILEDLKNAEYKIIDIKEKEVRRNPLPPFTTSTMQQDAARRLHYSARQTMMFAQRLYEKGHITYHRTDSLNLSQDFLNQVQKFVEPNYLEIKKYKAKKGAQEAHEAIRPTKISRKIDDNLYNLIWQRAIASQMKPAILDSVSIDIQAKNYIFRANGQQIKFDGFLKIYPMLISENILPKLSLDQIINLLKLIPEQHFTQPPPRYSEASLVKTLEKEGIGRPSTYAPIISTIQQRGYVRKFKGRFYPQEVGIIVNNLLVEHFPKIVDIKFTAHLEEDLDKIAQGEQKWQPVIREFYEPFAENLEKKYEEVKKFTEETDEKCPECGEPLIVRMSRFGKFLGCSGFPKCRFT